MEFKFTCGIYFFTQAFFTLYISAPQRMWQQRDGDPSIFHFIFFRHERIASLRGDDQTLHLTIFWNTDTPYFLCDLLLLIAIIQDHNKLLCPVKPAVTQYVLFSLQKL